MYASPAAIDATWQQSRDRIEFADERGRAFSLLSADQLHGVKCDANMAPSIHASAQESMPVRNAKVHLG